MKTTKLLLLLSLTLASLGSVSWLLSSRFSYKKLIQSSLPYSEKINWPEGISVPNSPDGRLDASSVFICKPACKFTSRIKEFNLHTVPYGWVKPFIKR